MRRLWKRKLAVVLAAVMISASMQGVAALSVKAEGENTVTDEDSGIVDSEDTVTNEDSGNAGSENTAADEDSENVDSGDTVSDEDSEIAGSENTAADEDSENVDSENTVSDGDSENDTLAAESVFGNGAVAVRATEAKSPFDGGIVSNGGFEEDLTGWDNWSESAKFKITQDSGYVKEGAKALFVESSSQDWVGLTQNVSVEKNTDYNFSFWGKNTSMFCYKIMDSSWGSNLVEQYPTGNGEWQEYTGTFNSGENETVIFYISDAAANGYYDNISIKKAENEEPAFDSGIVSNGGFEKDLEEWDNWSESNKFKITEDSGLVKEGVKALFVESSSQDWVGLTQNVSVEKNTDYNFSFWGKNTSMFCYKIMDSSWGSNLVEQYPTGNGEWQEYTGTFNSGENETVIFYISDAEANGYYDNISIKKAGNEVPEEAEFDGGFEKGNLDGWQNNDAPDRFTVSDEEAYEGTYSLKISSASQDWSNIMYHYPVAQNYRYRISFYAKGEATTYFKAINKGMSVGLAGGIPDNAKDEWTLNTYEFNTGSNDEIILYFADAAGTVYIDNIVIERLEAVPVDVTEVVNGDFSDGLNGWDTAAAGGKFTVSEGILHIDSSVAEGCYIEQQIPVVKGAYYTITVESESADVGYQVWDAEKQAVLSDGRIGYFCAGNNSVVALRIMDTEGEAAVDRVAIEEALIQPVNGRSAVNAAGSNKKVELVDADAAASVRSLFVYLQEAGRDNLLFGHQTDNSESIVKKDGITSDTYHTVGAYPAITGFEMSSMARNQEYYVQLVQAAYKNNSIATICDHMPNFSGGSYSDMTPTYEHIMPGGKDQEKFLERLDQTAAFAKACVDENGEPIPIIYRPFHENSGMWFWWGVSNTSKDQFINLWRFTVEYLRDVKGVHNLLYAYSPNGHFSSEDDYLSRYPGDEYVDIIGFDIYFDNPSYESKWMEQTLKDSQIAASIASKKGKVAAITEVGIRYDGSNGLAVEDNAVKDWFTQVYNMLMGDETAKQIAYMMTWRNQDKTHFWVPYDDGEGDRHEMANDFTVFYNSDNVVFADRMGNFADIDGIEATAHKESVYFVAPTTGEKMKGAADILLKTNAADVEKVTVTVGNHSYEAVLQDSYYVVHLDTTDCADGNYELKAIVALKNGTTLEASKTVKIWNDENTSDVDVRIFDDFDGYFGETEQLNQAYNRNTNGDVNSISLIDSPFGNEYGKAMKFDYSVATGGPGYSGTAKTLNYDISGLDSKGISFWYQGDGKGADILLQVNMPNCFEAHLNDLKSFDKDSTEPQFIEIAWEEFKPKGHTSQKELSNIQTYAIYVNGTGIEASTLIFDEIRVMTDNSGDAGNVVTKDEGGYLADADAVKDAVLTEEDKALVQMGTNIDIILDVRKTDEPSAADKALIQKTLNGKTVAFYLNIELYKKIGDGEAKPIHETEGKIGLVIPIPKEMIKDGRVFSVIYVHNGVAKALADRDSVADTVTIYADEFSTYALVYSDSAESPAPTGEPAPTGSPAPTGEPLPTESPVATGTPSPTSGDDGNDNDGGTGNAGGSTDNNLATSPKTGDGGIVWWAILALAAGSMILGLTGKYYASKEE